MAFEVLTHKTFRQSKAQNMKQSVCNLKHNREPFTREG